MNKKILFLISIITFCSSYYFTQPYPFRWLHLIILGLFGLDSILNSVENENKLSNSIYLIIILASIIEISAINNSVNIKLTILGSTLILTLWLIKFSTFTPYSDKNNNIFILTLIFGYFVFQTKSYIILSLALALWTIISYLTSNQFFTLRDKSKVLVVTQESNVEIKDLSEKCQVYTSNNINEVENKYDAIIIKDEDSSKMENVLEKSIKLLNKNGHILVEIKNSTKNNKKNIIKQLKNTGFQVLGNYKGYKVNNEKHYEKINKTLNKNSQDINVSKPNQSITVFVARKRNRILFLPKTNKSLYKEIKIADFLKNKQIYAMFAGNDLTEAEEKDYPTEFFEENKSKENLEQLSKIINKANPDLVLSEYIDQNEYPYKKIIEFSDNLILNENDLSVHLDGFIKAKSNGSIVSGPIIENRKTEEFERFNKKNTIFLSYNSYKAEIIADKLIKLGYSVILDGDSEDYRPKKLIWTTDKIRGIENSSIIITNNPDYWIYTAIYYQKPILLISNEDNVFSYGIEKNKLGIVSNSIKHTDIKSLFSDKTYKNNLKNQSHLIKNTKSLKIITKTIEKNLGL